MMRGLYDGRKAIVIGLRPFTVMFEDDHTVLGPANEALFKTWAEVYAERRRV